MQTHQDAMENPGSSDHHWRNLNYDIGWEASPAGVIHCRSVLNRRSDLFQAIEGLNLSALYCEIHAKNAMEMLKSGPQIRHVEVRLPRSIGPERLYLTGQLLPDERFVGTFSALSARHDANFFGQLALLSEMTQARTREETYRREAECMLEGLRLLLGQDPVLEKLKSLARLMAKAIKGSPHLLLRISRNGMPLHIDGDAAILCDTESIAEFFRKLDSVVNIVTRENPPIDLLRKLVQTRDGDIAVIFLPVASESIALICAAPRFDPADIDFASRFVLILRQALTLKDEQDKLIQSAKMSALGHMSASLAHELRQPLNTISMTTQNLELMAEDGRISREDIQPKLDRIMGQVERASQIMDRIRGFSRKGSEVLAEVRLVQLAQGVRVLMEHLLVAAGVRLEIDISPVLFVSCDPVKIEQVVVNLVRNAMDALGGIGSTGKKAGEGVITIRGEKTTHGTVLRVEDNGPGFPPDVSERPLETFYTTKSAEAGTGLGLSICHMIARDHGGKLELGNHGDGAFVALHVPDRGLGSR